MEANNPVQPSTIFGTLGGLTEDEDADIHEGNPLESEPMREMAAQGHEMPPDTDEVRMVAHEGESAPTTTTTEYLLPQAEAQGQAAPSRGEQETQGEREEEEMTVMVGGLVDHFDLSKMAQGVETPKPARVRGVDGDGDECACEEEEEKCDSPVLVATQIETISPPSAPTHEMTHTSPHTHTSDPTADPCVCAPSHEECSANKDVTTECDCECVAVSAVSGLEEQMALAAQPGSMDFRAPAPLIKPIVSVSEEEIQETLLQEDEHPISKQEDDQVTSPLPSPSPSPTPIPPSHESPDEVTPAPAPAPGPEHEHTPTSPQDLKAHAPTHTPTTHTPTHTSPLTTTTPPLSPSSSCAGAGTSEGF
eukprot:gnl/Trimastix_PCT/2879.p2 GENE.gnl/Trimastix_PCT/2879~~gnl/Trimastix_PCT/2879.p2  ORF type:complete len:423 (-),score=65.55 gnl/Trimastix_PCT/2879:1099-2187(-)